MTHDGVPGRGEERLKNNRKRYRNIIIGLLVAGGVIGGVTGVATGLHLERGLQATTVPSNLQWLAIAGVALFVIAVAVGSWIYFRTIDELELEANKLAGLIGLNVYGVLFMSWWPLSEVGVAPAPDGETIFLITMTAAIAAFAWRRFR